MEAELIHRLSCTNEYSKEFTDILGWMMENIHLPTWDAHVSKLVTILINFTSQLKFSNQQNHHPQTNNYMNSGHKTHEDYCLDLIFRLLLKLMKIKDYMMPKITELFFKALQAHVDNINVLTLFYKLMFFSEKFIQYIQKNNYIGTIVEIYENLILEISRESEDSKRTKFMNQNQQKYFYGGSDFYSNLQNHLQQVNSSRQFEGQAMIQSFTNREVDERFGEHRQSIPISNFEHFHNDPILTQFGTNNPNSEQSSFYLSTGNITTHSLHKGIKIPILCFPSSFNEKPNSISRSTRRIESSKSQGKNSNRMNNNFGFGASSKDGELKDVISGTKNENDESMSDNQHNSHLFDNFGKIGAFQTKQEEMKSLASQLGEYCLIMDLGCILAQKRKLQLDKAAHMTVLQDVDAIIDFKTEERDLNEKITNTRYKSAKKNKLLWKSADFGLSMNFDLKGEVKNNIVDSSSDSDLEGLKINVSPGNYKRGSSSAKKAAGRQMEKSKKKQELKTSLKAAHMTANILFLLLKDMNMEDLQQYHSLVNLFYMGLSSNLSQNIRRKEEVKAGLSLNYWADGQEEQFFKDEKICEGIDNIERINQHFEKALFEKKHGDKQLYTQKHPLYNMASSSKSNLHSSSSQMSYINYFESQVLRNDKSSNVLQTLEESTEMSTELALMQELMDIESITLAESEISFRVLNLFALVSEKVHGQLYNKQVSELPQDSYNLAMESPHSPTESILSTNKVQFKIESESDEVSTTDNLVKEYTGSSQNFKFMVYGQQMNPNKEEECSLIKSKCNPFIHKYSKKLKWVLNQLDMNSQFFYDIEIEQLNILDGFLRMNTSRVGVVEVLDNVFDSLLLVKKQIMELSISYLSGVGTSATNTRMATPNLTAKIQILSSVTRDLPTSSAPTSTSNKANNILKSALRTNISSRSRAHPEGSPPQTSPQKDTLDRIDEDKPESGGQFYSKFMESFIYKHKELFVTYLSIISKLITGTNKTEVYALMNEIFISNSKWTKLVKLFTMSIFKEIMLLCEKVGENNVTTLSKEQVNLFIYAKKILNYYTSILIMCNSMSFTENLQALSNDPSKKKMRSAIRRALEKMMFLVKPHKGLLSRYISFNAGINSLIINPNIQSLSNYNLLRTNLYSGIYDFVRKVFSFPDKFSCFLTEELSTFYIRLSYLNFVKIYSYSSNTELNEISKRMGDMSKMRENINEDLDYQMGIGDNQKNKFSVQKNYQVYLSKQYIKVLYSIANNRNDEIQQKFYYYGILEFFTREISLEFEITQMRERFLRIRNESKKNMNNRREVTLPAPSFAKNDVKKLQKTYEYEEERKQKEALIDMGARTRENKPREATKNRLIQKLTWTLNNHPDSKTENIINKHISITTPGQTSSVTKSGIPDSPEHTLILKGKIHETSKVSSILDSPPTNFYLGNNLIDNVLQSGDYYKPPPTRLLTPNNKASSVHSINFPMTPPMYKNRGLSPVSPPGEPKRTAPNIEQQGRRFRLSPKQTKAVEKLIKSQIEQSNILVLHDEQMEQVHQVQNKKKTESTMHRKLKDMIKQDVVKKKAKQGHSSSVVQSDSNLMKSIKNSRNFFGSPSNSNKKTLMTEMETKMFSKDKERDQHMKVYGIEKDPRESSKHSSFSKSMMNTKVSPKRTKVDEYHPKSTKGLQEKKYAAVSKSLAGGFKEPLSEHVIKKEKVKTGGLNKKSIKIDESLGSQEVLADKSKSKLAKVLGTGTEKENKYSTKFQLPSFLVEKSQLPGPDPKYAGSPRDSDSSSSGSEYRLWHEAQEQSRISAMSQKMKITPLNFGSIKESKNTSQEQEPAAEKPSVTLPIAEKKLSLNLNLNLNMSSSLQKTPQNAQSQVKTPPLISLNISMPKESSQSSLANEKLSEDLFYYSERKLRKIYEDNDLHSLMISLMISLLLTPKKGTLDEHYTSQYPVDENKQNILYILHFHLNHPSNQHIPPLVLSRVVEISSFPAGQRLLKLLCVSLSDMSRYTDRRKIGGGAYGTVFECNTNLVEPKTVAIKETKFPSSIHDRCVLHDIFTEITCLEQFRLNPVVTDIYDFGVTDSSYMIVMKKYPMSLREWRSQQEGHWTENLPAYLTIYKEILKIVSMLHSCNITHYDLKCDNVMLEYRVHANNESDVKIVLCDFGECKIFLNEQDEYCMRNRGTEYIKPPEMLTLAINCKREADTFDRRKKVGTTRASDIWSLGCLLYEILTGDFLFYNPDLPLDLYIRLTSPNQPLLSQQKLEKIDNNAYIIDFLRFILVKDPLHRPSIASVLKRFEHVHAIMVSNITSLDHHILKLNLPHPAPENTSLDVRLSNFIGLLFSNTSIVHKRSFEDYHKPKHAPTYMKITEAVSLCSKTYFLMNSEKLIKEGITHVVSLQHLLEESWITRFKCLMINTSEKQRLETLSFVINAKLMDFLRVAFFCKGGVLFVEDDDIGLNPKFANFILRQSLLLCLAHFMKLSVYEVWTFINSQLLFLTLPYSHIALMSKLMVHHTKLMESVQTLPQIQCNCGCCTIILKRQFNVDKNMFVKTCSCSRESQTNEFSECPSDGCAEYIEDVQNKFDTHWETLIWGYFNSSDFFIGPRNTDVVHDNFKASLILNSEGVSMNTTPYQKYIGKDSTRYLSLNRLNKNKWQIFQCKVCSMWLFAENITEQKYAVIINNITKQRSRETLAARSQNENKMKSIIIRNLKFSESK